MTTNDPHSVYVGGARPPDDDPQEGLPPGTLVGGRYEITGLLGSGGFGMVYEAVDRQGGGLVVALKEFFPVQSSQRKPDGTVSARNKQEKPVFAAGLEAFLGEARLLRELEHPGVVRVYDWLSDHGTAYMVMKRLKGRTLQSIVEAKERPDEATLRGWLSALLDALGAVHERGILHRDISPRNVVVTDEGAPVLIDFGAARQCIGKVSQTLTAIACPGYAPIEQYDENGLERQGPPTDLYALGATFYHLVTTNRPMASTSRVYKTKLRPAADVAANHYDKTFLQGIDKALEMNFEARWQTAAEWRKALEGRGEPSWWRRVLYWLVGAVVAVAVAVAGVYGYGEASKEPDPPAPAVVPDPPPEEFPPGKVFSDCTECPALVVIPEGHFQMGSPDDEAGRDQDEGPTHDVNIAKPFALGRHEVTFAEYDQCVSEKGCGHRPDDEGWGRGNRPVIDVSWNDAQAYVQWLSGKTGKVYRLPSEAEWEYAARAGSPAAYPWGGEIGSGLANCDGCGSEWDNKQTAPVGSFAANRFGLHDTVGNVWEWVEDCWNDSYGGAPADGSAWRTGDCVRRVVRGGSWFNVPDNARSANRFRVDTGGRGNALGFRLARTLF